MPVNRAACGAVSLFLLAACTGFPFFGTRSSPSSQETLQDGGEEDAGAPPHTVMELQDLHYDGWTLSGRLLISPEAGPLRLDRRLIPSIDVDVKRVSECEHGSVSSIHADVFAPENRKENLLVLGPGYWYGRTVRFGLFDEHLTGPGPECVEADVVLLSFDGKPVALQHIRATRPPSQATDGGTESMDGGTPAPPPPAP